jgi:predicted transcriptional regulator
MPAADVIQSGIKPTSLKMPAELKSQLEIVAERAGVSVHAFMLQAISNSVWSAQQRESFAEDSAKALRSMKTSGLGYELGDVQTHFAQMSAHRKGLGPKPAKLAATRLP